MNRLTLPLFLSFLFLSASLVAQTYPDRPAEFVSDFANIMDDEEEQRITLSLSDLKQSRDLEMKIVTINTMADYGFTGEIEPFATGLFNYWGIGDANRNDGILMLIAIDDRAMRIELGAGYPTHLNQTAKTIIEEIMIPHFKNGNYTYGIEKAVFEISHLIRLDSTESGLFLYPEETYTETSSSITWTLVMQVAGGILSSILGLLGFNKWRRQRPRRCPQCNGLMELLSDLQEDPHLSSGQKTEEQINSVQYDVWYCRNDQTVEVCHYSRWFSGYCKCKFCKNKTLDSTSETLEHATEYSTGTSRVTYNCEHCKETWSELHTIPMVTRSTSSSSGSSGGGHSSGGGASGRW